MPRISEIGYPDTMICIPGQRQRLSEEIRSIKSGIRRWGKSDQDNAWRKIQSLEWLDSELARLENRGVGQIRIPDFQKLKAKADARWAAETVRAQRRRNSEIQIELNSITAAIQCCTTSEASAAIHQKLDAISAELAGQTVPASAARKSRPATTATPTAARLPLDAKFANQKALADRRLGKTD